MDLIARIAKKAYQREYSFGLSLLIDFGILVLAYTTVLFSRSVLTALDISKGLVAIVFAALLTLAVMYLFGVYQRIWKQTSGHEVMIIVYSVVVSTVIFIGIDLIVQPRPLPLSVPIVGCVLALAGLVAVRYRSRLISSLRWRWRAVWNREFPTVRTRVLIVGAGESGQDLAWRLRHRFPDNNYQVIGFIDDDPQKHGMYVEGCRVLGGRQQIIGIVERSNIDLIVVAIHNIPGPAFREILTLCEESQARIKVIPDVFELVRNPGSKMPLRDIQPEDLLGRSVVVRHEAVDLSPVTHKIILVTGAAGSIGSELSHQVMDYDPVKVILLDNNESGLHDLVSSLSTQFPNIDMVPALVDITYVDAVRSIFKAHQPQIVFHAAAYKHVPMLQYYPREALRVNINGTMNLAEMAMEHHVERFVLVSTDKAVNPTNIMGASKRVGEILLHAFSQEPDCNTLFTAVRFGNVLGSRGSVIPTFNRQINNSGPVTVTHPDMTRYFMSIPEAVNLIIHAGCLTVGDEIFVLKMGEVVRILDLAERMIRLRGLRPYKDIEIKFTGVRPGEKMHEELFYQAENPEDTLHPNIVKLNNWPDNFDSAQFFNNLVRVVVHNDAEPKQDYMQILLQLAEADKRDQQASDRLQDSIATNT